MVGTGTQPAAQKSDRVWSPALANTKDYGIDCVWVWSSTYSTADPRLKLGRYENIWDIADMSGLMTVKYHSSLKQWRGGAASQRQEVKAVIKENWNILMS